MDTNRSRWRAALLSACLCAAVAASPLALAAEGSDAAAQAERQVTQPLNNAPLWREVRKGENPYQTTQVRGIETNVLVQPQGQTWREIRNGPITVYGGWLLVLVAALIAFYYWLKGPLTLHEKPAGRTIERFTAWERAVHWATAISFVILALTGAAMLFGRYVVLPVLGYTLFSWIAIIAKNLHNFVGPLFIACAVLMFATFVKHNMPKAYDRLWLRKLGGMFGSREPVPCGHFNAGEKLWFWIGVTALAVVSAVTGFILDFPNFEQGRGAMQLANVIHAVSAVLFTAMALGHIYLGTIGVEGAYGAMRNGTVDETWAKEHHQYWYEEMKSGQAHAAGGAVPAGAPRMKEKQ